jgi:hypothetical protein
MVTKDIYIDKARDRDIFAYLRGSVLYHIIIDTRDK